MADKSTYVSSREVELLNLAGEMPEVPDDIEIIKGLVGQPDMEAYRKDGFWYMRQPKCRWLPYAWLRVSPRMADQLTVSYARACEFADEVIGED